MEHLDSELIILGVKKYPCLYNINDKDFKNRKIKRESWVAVTADVLGEKWHQMDHENKVNIGNEVQKRWKSMRDSYIKSIKSQEARNNAGSAKSNRPYVFHKQMSFLQLAFRTRKIAGNMNNYETKVNGNEMSTCEPSQVRVSTQKSSNKGKPDSFKREIVNVLKANIVTPQIPDLDEMFLLSQLPLIKQMKPANKLDFQVKFMQLLQSYVVPSNTTLPISPYSSTCITPSNNPPATPPHLKNTLHSPSNFDINSDDYKNLIFKIEEI